jgi:DNA-binding IclR family transcriptional regulator
MPRTGRSGDTGFARDLDILEAIAQSIAGGRGGLRVTEIAERTDRDKSQVSRALSRLEAAGLVARDADGRSLQLGWKLFHLAAMTAENRLIAHAQPAMREIVVSIGETVHLCVLRGTACVTVHSEIPQHGFRGLAWVGVEAPAHVLTAGRALLAECSDDELRKLYPRERLPNVPPTGRIHTRTQLLRECAGIRERGYAAVDEEFEPGLVGASAALHDFRGIAVASLNVAAPKHRLGGKLDALGKRLRIIARRLSIDLGMPRTDDCPGASPRRESAHRPGINPRPSNQDQNYEPTEPWCQGTA